MSEARRSIGAFVDAIERATSVSEIGTTFLSAVAHLGFEHAALFTCGPLETPGERTIGFVQIPEAWLKRYYDRRYDEIDPVYNAVRGGFRPFRWDDPAYRRNLTSRQIAMLAESDEAGMVGGLAIPIREPKTAPACCTLVPSVEGVDPASYSIAHSLAVFTYASVQNRFGEALRARKTRLSKRERECLLLAAQGRTDWAISEVLGISERTVHHAIERAKCRFGVTTRVQAVVHAIAAGEFCATDVIG